MQACPAELLAEATLKRGSLLLACKRHHILSSTDKRRRRRAAVNDVVAGASRGGGGAVALWLLPVVLALALLWLPLLCCAVAALWFRRVRRGRGCCDGVTGSAGGSGPWAEGGRGWRRGPAAAAAPVPRRPVGARRRSGPASSGTALEAKGPPDF